MKRYNLSISHIMFGDDDGGVTPYQINCSREEFKIKWRPRKTDSFNRATSGRFRCFCGNQKQLFCSRQKVIFQSVSGDGKGYLRCIRDVFSIFLATQTSHFYDVVTFSICVSCEKNRYARPQDNLYLTLTEWFMCQKPNQALTTDM